MSARDDDGYRYIRESRSYRSDEDGKLYAVSRYALFERQDGRARRVGTCDSYPDALAFMSGVKTETEKGINDSTSASQA